MKEKLKILYNTLKEKGLPGLLKLLKSIVLWRLAIITEYIYVKQLTSTKKIIKVLGYNMIVDLKDKGVSRDLFYYKIREPSATVVYSNELRKCVGDILEIGANIGYYAMLEANITSSKIIAVEPNRLAFNLLLKNIELNNYGNKFEVYNLALGDKEGAIRLNCTASYNQSHIGNDINSIDIPMTTVDKLLNARKVSVIRMDVEGYEAAILKGARETLKNKLTIFIEYHPFKIKQYGYSINEFWSMLEDYMITYQAFYTEDKFKPFKRAIKYGRVVYINTPVKSLDWDRIEEGHIFLSNSPRN